MLSVVMESLEGRQLLAVLVPQFDHIVVVVEENRPYSKIIGSAAAPFINKLASHGALFTRSRGLTHPSQPNYLALFSGSMQGVTTNDCPVDFIAPSLGGALIAAGKTFAGYSEELPAMGSTVCASGGYTRKHNPWVDFADVPAGDNRPLTDFPTRFGQLPKVSFVIPTSAHNMHNGTIAAGDQWLADHLWGYAKWAKWHNSLLIVTWDEDDKTSNNHIATVFFGAHIKAGKYAQRISHFNVLRTMEEANSIGLLGESAGVAVIRDVWV
ncbi:MAG TPA: alkaline phosphatase family protein [Tepidisphaeraceae bacterium]|jgi:acid phosphatase|nr:alkaline phosphatase family protein [Tepidisphaeraceae bacterium]